MFSMFVTPQSSSSFCLPPSSTECHMFSVPAEIVQEIGRSLSLDSLKAFSSASHGLRDALLPLIVKDVSVSSMGQLRQLASYSSDLIRLIRNLTLTLNIEFFDSWSHDDDFPLANVLAKCPNLRSLTFQASNSPYDTPWNRLNVQDSSLRGISLGLESMATLPIFERLQHLELQTISMLNLDILLRQAPNLRSLDLTLPDGLTGNETQEFVQALRHVQGLKELTVSIADWDSPSAEGRERVKAALTAIAQRLPNLEKLDMRTKSYDMVDGILSYKCVEVEYETYLDIASVLPLFSNLRELWLPIQCQFTDATLPSMDLAKSIPLLHSISWMESVAFQGRTDEYAVLRSSDVLCVSRCKDLSSPAASTTTTTVTRRPRFALFDYLFESVVSSDKPTFLSDCVLSLSALMVVSSMVFSPVLLFVGLC